MTTKRSKADRLRVMQNRKDLMLSEAVDKNGYCNGDIPVSVIWKHRAVRQEMNRYSGGIRKDGKCKSDTCGPQCAE